MKAEIIFRVILFLGIFFALDLYVFKGIKLLTSSWSSGMSRQVTHIIYWVLSGGLLLAIAGAVLFMRQNTGRVDYTVFFYLFGIGLLFTLPKLVFAIFHLVEDLVVLVRGWFSNPTPSPAAGEKISRLSFLTRTGLVLSAIPFAGIAYGMLKGRFDFRVQKEVLHFAGLPKAFDGLKVVQISDLHLGSFFNNHKAVQKGIDMINALEPDVLVFTGDLVNNYAYEAEGWEAIFASLKAKMGKFSILGNHDYGDYVDWPDAAAKSQNLANVVDMNRKMGFNILLNENVILEAEGEKIAIAGVENWGKPPFPQHGDLPKALSGTEGLGFKLLLSHDPSHWDGQVISDSDVDLTLSGHTHGMQFGVEIGSIKWSPVKMKYPRWGGLYQEGKQFLYVNRGFGYIGFPGRVGMPPEITLLELRSGTA